MLIKNADDSCEQVLIGREAGSSIDVSRLKLR